MFLTLTIEKHSSPGPMSVGGITVGSDNPVRELNDLKDKRMVSGPRPYLAKLHSRCYQHLWSP